jgi:hypothetical protein
MSLDNIQLTPNILVGLFKNSLVDLQDKQVPAELAIQSSLRYLGKNARNIAILVNIPDVVYLPEKELDFLVGIMSACKLSMNDIAIINLASNERLDYGSIKKQLPYDKIFLFDVATSSLQIPLQVPHYQIQKYDQVVFLLAPSLAELENNREEKKKLWMSLKKIFDL